jgi:hypothetical protein
VQSKLVVDVPILCLPCALLPCTISQACVIEVGAEATEVLPNSLSKPRMVSVLHGTPFFSALQIFGSKNTSPSNKEDNQEIIE